MNDISLNALHLDAALAPAADPAFVSDLIAGLSVRPRAIAPKWFYDYRGSELFDAICRQPEYYPTRTELALLRTVSQYLADERRARGSHGLEIVEFGAGAQRKIDNLVEGLDGPLHYVPVDISDDYLHEAADRLRQRRPQLHVRPVVADLTAAFSIEDSTANDTCDRLGFYAGSSIGNFQPDEAIDLLERFGRSLQRGDLLIGVDLVKSPQRLHAAYNDAAGMTAAFNLNLLQRANDQAGADFNLHDWAHAALYNPPQRRIEMHLMSLRDQTVRIAGHRFEFEEGDSVHTENSYKYTVSGFARLARAAGWRPDRVWVDEQGLFSLHRLQWQGDSAPRRECVRDRQSAPLQDHRAR